MNTFNDALNSIMELSYNERSEIIEIIQKRQSQEWRKDTAEYYNSLKIDFQKGNLNPMNKEEALNELDNILLEN